MADIENWLISGTSCCERTKDPQEIKRQKVEAIFEHVSGDFVVGFIADHGHFWHVCLKYQRIHFRAAVSALVKKSCFICKERFRVDFAVIQWRKPISPAVKGQNCSFFDKSFKLGRVTNLYKTNIS